MIKIGRQLFLCLFLFLSALQPCFCQDIYDAARKGDTLRMLELLNANLDTLNKPNKDGFTPLILACYHHQSSTVAFILKRNVTIDFVSPEGTALMAAVYQNEEDLVKLLLQKKADPDLSNDQGTTALMLAVSGRSKNMVRVLLDYPCNRNIKDKEGRTALQIAQYMEEKELVEMLKKNN